MSSTFSDRPDLGAAFEEHFRKEVGATIAEAWAHPAGHGISRRTITLMAGSYAQGRAAEAKGDSAAAQELAAIARALTQGEHAPAVRSDDGPVLTAVKKMLHKKAAPPSSPALQYSYTDVSDEDLEIIRANECDAPGLVGKRVRRLWNEIERLRAWLDMYSMLAQQKTTTDDAPKG